MGVLKIVLLRKTKEKKTCKLQCKYINSYYSKQMDFKEEVSNGNNFGTSIQTNLLLA